MVLPGTSVKYSLKPCKTVVSANGFWVEFAVRLLVAVRVQVSYFSELSTFFFSFIKWKLEVSTSKGWCGVGEACRVPHRQRLLCEWQLLASLFFLPVISSPTHLLVL